MGCPKSFLVIDFSEEFSGRFFFGSELEKVFSNGFKFDRSGGSFEWLLNETGGVAWGSKMATFVESSLERSFPRDIRGQRSLPGGVGVEAKRVATHIR